MIKLGQMVLKGVNWVHNSKIRSYGPERSRLSTHGPERCRLSTQ